MSSILIIILLSILLSAFFSGVEIAFVSANKLKIELDKSRNKLSGKLLSWFNQRDSNFIAMLLLGNNIALVIYGIFMEEFLNPILNSTLTPSISSPIFNLLVTTIISTLIILIFAEFIPKASFRLNANRAIEIFSIPLLLIYIVMLPFVFAFIKVSEFVLLYIFRTKISTTKYQFSTIDLDHYIQEFHHENLSDNSEIQSDLQIFRNAIDFRTTKIRECMVPRTEIRSIEKKESIENLIKLFHSSGHSKIPIFEESIDNIVGYVHANDLIKKPKTIAKILRDVLFIPETMAANNMLNKMIKEHYSIAVVLDEFGGTSGIITMEDLMEEIFGEIEDEFDNGQHIERKLEDDSYLFSARLEIGYLNEAYHLGLIESDEYGTLGGYITFNYESIPEKGTRLTIGNHTFEIIQAGDTKIDLIKLHQNNNEI